MLFASDSNVGIVSGTYTDGTITWNTANPEFLIGSIPANGPPRLLLRPLAMAECNGVEYVTMGFRIYRRNDGPSPTWTMVNQENSG